MVTGSYIFGKTDIDKYDVEVNRGKKWQHTKNIFSSLLMISSLFFNKITVSGLKKHIIE